MKALIITDIDSYYLEPELEDDGVIQKTYKNGSLKWLTKPCPANDKNANKTSNNSLLFFHRKSLEDLKYFIELKTKENRILHNSKTKLGPK